MVGDAVRTPAQVWSERTRTMRGKERREYDAHWVQLYIDFPSNRAGTHKLHSCGVGMNFPDLEWTNRFKVMCVCGVLFIGAQEKCVTAFQAHIAEFEPPVVDVDAQI